MTKELLNNADGFEFDNNEIRQYINAKEKLDTIFEKVTNYRTLYLYDTTEKAGIMVDFDDVFNAALGTCLKLDAVTQDRHIARDHQIFYINHNNKIYRAFKMGVYKELRLAKSLSEGEYVIPKIEIIGFLDHHIQRLGGEI